MIREDFTRGLSEEQVKYYQEYLSQSHVVDGGDSICRMAER